MNHPVLGEPDGLKDGGWGLTVVLPAFQPFYERGYNDGGEREDTRGVDEMAGRFWVRIPPIPVDGPGLTRKQLLPSDARVAAVESLKVNQDRIAGVVRQALVDQAAEDFHWVYLKEALSDVMWEKLTSPERMMQVVELQSILLGTIDEDGQTKVGFAFHSEILEPEHGVRVIVHRDQPVLVGTWDCLSAMDDDVDYDNHAGYDKEGEYDEE